MKRHIPNTLTLLNLVCGFAATVCAIKGYNDYASFCIMAGMVFDFSDGFAARLLKAWSAIGKDLDSLADVVTFGIAPGAIVMNLLTAGGMNWLPAFVISALIPAASALRLAKFNNDTSQSVTFRGMATPASAFTVVSVTLSAALTDSRIYEWMAGSLLFLSLLAMFLAVMMLVNLRMFSLKFQGTGWKDNEERYIFAGLSLLLLFIFRMKALPMIMAAYIIISLLFPFIAGRRTGSGVA
jgi:CDP-diacylglycerol--serine O-phosphatidyltransferase